MTGIVRQQVEAGVSCLKPTRQDIKREREAVHFDEKSDDKGSEGACKHHALNADIDDVHLDDPEAWVIQTRYPSRTPVLDQVYSLISHELKYIFNAKHMDWKDDITSQLVNDRHLHLAAKSILINGDNRKRNLP